MGVFAAERGDIAGWYVITFLMGLFFVLGQASVSQPDVARDEHPQQRIRQRVLSPATRIPWTASPAASSRLHLPAGTHWDEQIYSGAGHSQHRRLLLLAFRRHRVDLSSDERRPTNIPNRSARLTKLGFTDPVAVGGRTRRRLRRRLSGGCCVLITDHRRGLALAVTTPTPQVAVADESSALRTGETTFLVCPAMAPACRVPDHGPSLIGVGGGRRLLRCRPAGCRPCTAGRRTKDPIFDEARRDRAYIKPMAVGRRWYVT